MKKQTNDNYLLHQVCSNPHLVEQCSMWLKKDDKMAGDIQTKKKMTGSNIMSHLNNHHTSQPNDNKDNNQSTAAQISLHILLVTETWQPDINGVSLSLYQIMSALVAMGHKVSLIRPAPQNMQDLHNVQQKENSLSKESNSSFRRDKIILHDIHVKGMPIPRYPDLQLGVPAYTTLRRTYDSIKPDVVHIATEGPLGLAALMAAKHAHIAVTTGYHTQFHDFSKHFGFGILARPLMSYFKYMHNWSDATCVPSQKTQDDLRRLGFKRLYQVSRGVDTMRFHPNKRNDTLRASWSAGQQHTVLMMVSRLSPEKGVDLVMRPIKHCSYNSYIEQ